MFPNKLKAPKQKILERNNTMLFGKIARKIIHYTTTYKLVIELNSYKPHLNKIILHPNNMHLILECVY